MAISQPRSPVIQRCLLLVAWLMSLAFGDILPARAAETGITQAPDHSVTVVTALYKAHIDAHGNLTEFAAENAPIFTQRFLDAKGKPFTDVVISVVNQMVAVRSGEARTEWTFGEDRVSVLTEGFAFECLLDKSVKVVLEAGGKSRPYEEGKVATGGVNGLVLANGFTALAVAKGQAFPMHIHSPRILPNSYTNGFGKVGDKLEWTWVLGGRVGVAQLITALQVDATGADEMVLQTTGNRGKGVVHFPGGVPVAFTVTQQNQSTTEKIGLEYRVELWDHYIWGLPFFKASAMDPPDLLSHRLASLSSAVTLLPLGGSSVNFKLPELSPGFYYLFVSAWQKGEKLTESECIPVTVDLPAYQPKTTRPADFAEFWQQQETLLAATPMNARSTRISPEGTKGELWEITGDMPGGNQFYALYEIPSGPPAKHVLLSSNLPSILAELKTAASAPEWESKATMPTLQVSPIDACTYTRWDGTDNNNLLDNILLWLRAVDYLTTRPEIEPHSIRLFGASRGGPLVLITAALRPADIAGAAAHVHTSCGIGWTHKPYNGWGMPGGHNPRNPEHSARLAAMGAYVDPVNHAEKIRCPITFAYGVSDFGLSPPEGIEAAYQLCGSAWKRISRDAGGHVFTDGTRDIMKQLDDYLESAAGSDNQDRIMKEH